ncbi:MAG: hypothetical protein PHE33_06465 [Bacteroidales bacterium]|nr:hypothetical protein [Bacteroidales bacterium]
MEPTWTDIIQAIAAIIAIPGAITAFVILFLKDKQQESQINKLTRIVKSLNKSNAQAMMREKTSKRPFISLSFQHIKTNLAGGNVRLDIINSNPISNIVTYDANVKSLGFNNYSVLTVGNSGNQQIMGVQLNYSGNIPTQGGVISIDYVTEEGFEYVQEIYVDFDTSSNTFNTRGLQIILKENMKE